MFGKWHLGESGTSLPQDFDAWQIFPGQGEYHDPEMITAEGSATVPGCATDIVTDLTLDWIDEQGGELFCALVHHKAPHRPWQPHEKLRDLYPVGTIPEPLTLLDDYSDQGFFLGDHGWYDKRFMYDQSLKMPLLIRWPAQLPAGTELGAILTNVDFAATLLEACGAAASAALPQQQGRSFLHLLRGEEDPTWPESMYYRYWEHDSEPHHVWSDPEELTNLADSRAHAGIRAELEAELARLQAHYRDAPYVA